LDKSGVRDLLYRSDSLVLASRSEVQPLVLLEAMSTGIPVVSTECVPRCQRLSGCTIVPIGDAEALARAMRTVAEQPQNQGIVFAEEVRRLASPAVVGRQLETIFKEILEC
jgi:glycosyltransferase involved in cell wall biosynthesis